MWHPQVLDIVFLEVFDSVQFSSVAHRVRLFATLCTAGHQASLCVRGCLKGGFLCAASHKSSTPYQWNSKLLPGLGSVCETGLGLFIGSPSVNILFMTKLLCLDPLSWDIDCLLTLWPLLIPYALGNGCCTFSFLIFIIAERNSLYNSLHILTKRSLKHLCSIRA